MWIRGWIPVDKWPFSVDNWVEIVEKTWIKNFFQAHGEAIGVPMWITTLKLWITHHFCGEHD